MNKVYLVMENITTDEVVKAFQDNNKAIAYAVEHQKEMRERGYKTLITHVVEMEVL